MMLEDILKSLLLTFLVLIYIAMIYVYWHISVCICNYLGFKGILWWIGNIVLTLLIISIISKVLVQDNGLLK